MTLEKDRPYQGKCLCGAIRYEVDNIGARMAHCHCSMCRKFHGAAFATYGEAKQAEFRWLSGLAHLKSFRADNGTTRQFCEICGSSLTFSSDNYDEDVIEFALATLDSELELKPDAHIYTRYKACWYSIEDKLPQYKEGRNEERHIQEG